MERLLALVTMLALAGCGDSDEVQEMKRIRDENLARYATISKSSAVDDGCLIGNKVDRKELALNSAYEIRNAPNGEKKYNPVASEALKRPYYYQIDTSTTVEQKCADGDWTLVKITSPTWLADREGWAPNIVFRNIERSSDGARIYVDTDLYWDEHSSPYKRSIVAKINEISRETRCREIQPDTIAMSPTRSLPGRPVFFVTCGTGAGAFNVWFEPN
ncbi:hypothetical protein IFT66_14690 [Rhizobium sp. CFBP 13726]|uniref:hypothetical protein n=1 Tax=Rhizobium sp. CFBP 13726 TaxID=2775296 RepID=UPI00177BAD6F|nr:hypothetical protein [Rhizobium sp. CFBP 13726]MBD8652333.1 hypothetical protein [Rhizobium sp. CFBP 13726]